ncbi:MAG: divergent PAP2 family protein [Anaerolineaceae bacterium]|jgi:acid phosphatase family membrane protein YuiD
MLEWLYNYSILLSGLIAWWLAQFLKVPIGYLITRRWNWALWFSSGGMPSSHSALVTAMSTAIGLWAGFDTPAFAVSLALAMVVVYDAAGVRRQAGIHAQRINHMINELFRGQPISEVHLKEVLGHTPRQVLGGVLLGIVAPVVIYLLWQ